jgi:hypothetical protein
MRAQSVIVVQDDLPIQAAVLDHGTEILESRVRFQAIGHLIENGS